MKYLISINVLYLILNFQITLCDEFKIIRGQRVESGKDSEHKISKLLCITDTINDAITWNTNLDWNRSIYAFSDRENLRNVPELSLDGEFIHKERKCDINAGTDKCKVEINVSSSDWNIVSNIEVPMGPVFDSRWERFEEYNTFELESDVVYHPVKIKKKGFEENLMFGDHGTLIVSIRGGANAHILICDGANHRNSFCYWIIIGGWKNICSVIRKCANGVDGIPKDGECSARRRQMNHHPLSIHEWKTFLITWNANNHGIVVYNPDSVILDYADDDAGHDLNWKYHIFFGNSEKMDFPTQFRFHIYNYTLTTQDKSHVSSDVLKINTNGEICIDMMVGLCTRCELQVFLINAENREVVLQKNFSGLEIPNAVHGLPMWQHARISASNLNITYRSVILQMFTHSTNTKDNHFAIRSIQQCPPEGTVKKLYMTANQGYKNGYYFWPKVTCQRLSYNKSHTEVISPRLDETLGLIKPPDDLTLCPVNRIGPQCATHCDPYFRQNCSDTIICDRNGCYCPQGHYSYECSIKCPTGNFGYGCGKKCNNCQDEECNIYTGVCTKGCGNLKSKYQYVPPYCKDAVAFPDLQYDQRNETTLRVYFPKFDPGTKLNITYEFVLKVGKDTRRSQAESDIEKGIPIYFATFDDLRKGMTYDARISQHIQYESFGELKVISLDGDFSKQSTMCIWAKNFKINTKETNLTILKVDSEGIFSCPDDWYTVKVYEAKSNIDEISQTNNLNVKFPMTIESLTADTEYVILITGLSSTFQSRHDVRTLPKKLPPVRLLKIIFVNTTEALIEWVAPIKPDGIIESYSLTVKALRYLGCDTSSSITFISSQRYTILNNNSNSYIIKKLIPYVQYELTISAYYKRQGEEYSKEFETKSTEIPTAIFENLSYENDKIKWNLPVVNCSTITGPLSATKLFFFGISENVRDFTYEYITNLTSFKLDEIKDQAFYGSEQYRVRIHALRRSDGPYNESAYVELNFTTDPRPPPKVRNLTIVEVDTVNRNVSLKWNKPLPPTHGEIIRYQVILRGYSDSSSHFVYPNETCFLWENWLCKTVSHLFYTIRFIEVCAENKGVSKLGEISQIPYTFKETAPDAPGTVLASPIGRGTVNLHWEHPFRTGGPMKQFIIQRQIISTRLIKKFFPIDLRESIHFDISNYQKFYGTELDVWPSTYYEISIQGVVSTLETQLFGELSTTRFKTKSSFTWNKDEPSYIVDNMTHSITLFLPVIANYTVNGKIYVAVIGEPQCQKIPILTDSLAKDIELEDGQVAWHVGTFSKSPMSVIIGNYANDDMNMECSLREGNAYVVVTVVREDEMSIPKSEQAQPLVWRSEKIQIGPVPRKPHEIWAVPLLLLIIIVVGLVFYLTRKKKRIEKGTNNVIVDVPRSVASLSGAWKRHVKPPSSLSMTQRPDTVEYRESILLTPAVSIEKIAPTPINDETYEKIKCTSLVKLNGFQDYVKRAIASGKLNEQYSFFPRGQMKSWAYGELPENKRKNRYGNLIAYDETRVILEKLPDDPYSDYINANYIKGYKKNHAYIATQGPKSTTVIDFWRMIWQEHVQVICMLANVLESGKTKCEQYWPEIGKVIKYGNISVSNISHVQFADYTFRIFHLKHDQEIRKIDHLHYTAWPDHGIPLYTQSVVSYLKKLLATPSGNGPVVIHCSAGVGRTGTIILCDICLRRAAAEGVVDVFGETDEIRKQRANMVDNKQQYILAHVALVECLLSLPTAIPCNDLLPTRIQEYKNQLTLQQQRLEQSAWQDEALQSSPRLKLKLSERNIAKNRFPDLLPLTRLFIPRHPITDDDSSYIHGVYVDSARRQNSFIATQLPLPKTVADFWRMVAEFKVQLIIILQPPDTEDPTCCKFVPEPDQDISPLTFLNIKGKSITDGEHCIQQKITLIDNSTKTSREQSITILTCKEWDPGRNSPPPKPETLVDLWQVAERISRNNEPAVIICHDGVTGCGLYLALSFLLERMGLEHECDVCLAIRAIRRSRSDFCQTREQFEYLYDAALIYNGYFETYANFT